jgi:hypothetical protein
MDATNKTLATKDDLTQVIRNYKKTIIWGMFISSATQVAALWLMLELFVKK